MKFVISSSDLLKGALAVAKAIPAKATAQIRECFLFELKDGKLDITIQRTGRQATEDFADVLLQYLHDNDGRCDLGDKSPSELISDRFKVSKKTFKKAIGDLYKRRLITIGDDGITLV